MSKYVTYIGTYGFGIAILSVDSVMGGMELLGFCSGYQRPTYLKVSEDKRFLYAGVGLDEFSGTGGGALAAFAIDGAKLHFLNARPSFGGAPCHVMTDRRNRYIFAANYGEGSGVGYRLAADGAIEELGETFQHSGRGPHPTRQEKAHAHCVELSPSEQFLYVVDLGIDTAKAYAVEQDGRILTPAPAADLHEAPGAGPRHIVFSQDGHFAYLLNELDSTVSVWDVTEATVPARLQTLSILPKSWRGENTAAAIKLSEDGSRLCCSNRGHDSLAIFAVDKKQGVLSLMGFSPTLGRGPRDFAFVPGERFILAAHQYTDNLVTHAFDAENGRLAIEPAATLTLPQQQPVCVKFGNVID